ncbi:Enolase [Acidilobus saccharovorans 345-15]|uniref:Enolase n=1 Tax=Acidilobus saccharovorans (strain DSM 16705 / JCM 18335 / VKM B-2471 / 345-15) TaxID=666510 RepID=D9Q1Q0_ACIS3|nr:phosphopyruvate hydratase [Acidilobus saccharovorans]ADL19238.1 Enolase [Acidilobus saccharovorans 345-15]
MASDEDFIISSVHGVLALDSRGNPTVKVIAKTKAGVGVGIAPSGASKSSKEAIEKRDGGRGWGGMGVNQALSNVNTIVAPRLIGLDSRKQSLIDGVLIEIDGTPNKSRLGGNVTTATSIAVAKAAAASSGVELYEYLGGPGAKVLPTPLMNVINGGVHAGNNLAFQEFIIIPAGAPTFTEAMRMAVEVYKSLKSYLSDKYGKTSTNVGDEGGYAPPMNEVREPLEALRAAIKAAGYELGSDFFLGIDAASSEFYDPEKKAYRVDGKLYDPGSLLDLYVQLVDEFSIAYLEDPFHEEDLQHFSEITAKLGSRVLIVGDDLYATNVKYLQEGIKARATNGALVKVNQVGTLTETLDYIRVARNAGIRPVISHRSGDTEDPFIADLAVAVGAGVIKTGAPARSERLAKYNRLLEIEDSLGPMATYAGREPFITRA